MKMNLVWSLLVVGAVPLFFSACDKDEEPKKSNVGFEDVGVSVTESDGTVKSFHPLQWQQFDGSTVATGREIKIKIVLDRPMPETSVIQFSHSGKAAKNSATTIGDFDIAGNTIVIEKGAVEAFLTFTLFEDFEFEYDENSLDDDGLPFETLNFKLESVVSGPAVLGEKKEFAVKIYEDDTIVFLDWDPQDAEGENRGDVNMDLFIWHDEEIWAGSAQNNNDYEAALLPGGFPAGEYGLSYTYVAGTSNDVKFYVEMINFGGNVGSAPTYSVTSTQNLTSVNKNNWRDPANELNPIIVHTMVKSGLNYGSISTITRPDNGSRQGNTLRFDKSKLESLSVVPATIRSVK